MPGGGCSCQERRAQVITRNQFGPLAITEGARIALLPIPLRPAQGGTSCVSVPGIGRGDRTSCWKCQPGALCVLILKKYLKER